MSRADKPISVVRGADNIPWNQRDREHLVANYEHGMTLLEHYAGLAMQGLIANSYASDRFQVASEMGFAETADAAIKHARALIAELEKQTP